MDALTLLPGLIVSVLIFKQGWSLLLTAFGQLTDAGVSPRTKRILLDALEPLVASSSTEPLLGISDVRAMRTGANMFVDVVAHVPTRLGVEDVVKVETRIREALVAARRDVKEVRVRFKPKDPTTDGHA